MRRIIATALLALVAAALPVGATAAFADDSTNGPIGCCRG
jgi:hypothetical protein